MNYVLRVLIIAAVGCVVFAFEDWRSRGFLTKRGWTKIKTDYLTHPYGSHETIETWKHDRTGEIRRECSVYDAGF